MVELVIAHTAAPTGRILSEAIKTAGGRIGRPGKVRVSYGVSLVSDGRPTLNSKAGRLNKFEELQALKGAGITIPPFTRSTPDHYPALARRFQHARGSDIVVALQREHADWLSRGGRAQFFTKYIEFDREYRTWVFQKNHLGTYEKVMEHPAEYRRVGSNRHNGFSFRLVGEANIPRAAVDAAINSVAALGLDFGAVDIIHGKDGIYYVLEVNTAPGVEGPARQVMKLLAAHIVRFANGKVGPRER